MVSFIVLVLLSLQVTPVAAQSSFILGVKGGLFFDDAESVAYKQFTTDESRWYTIGGSAGLMWNNRFGLGGDILYKRLGQSAQSLSGLQSRANAWEFPVYGRVFLAPSRQGLNPFASAGYSFRRAVFTTQVASSVPTSYEEPPDNQHGFNAGVGFRSRIAERWAVTMEYRYTHWSVDDEVQPRFLMDRRNQHEVLFTFGF